MNLLNPNDIGNLKKYKYVSEDSSMLYKIYFKFWDWFQSYIPKYIHPNLITLFGIFFIIFGYTCYNLKYSNLIMGIGILVYMNMDSIDGIHARKTKQISIIGEYFDHLGDLVVLGFVGTYLCNMVGFANNLLIKNIILILSSINFIKHHYDTIHTQKMIFTELSDTSLILTIISFMIFINFKLPLQLINNYWIILLFGIPILYQLIEIYKQETSDNNLNYFKFIYFIYWLLKIFMGFINPVNSTWMITLIDLPLLLDTINFKIFKKTFVNPYLLLSLPLLSSLSTMYCYLTVIGVFCYLAYFIHNISSQLKINIFLNPPSVYLPRVYCCGVFDLCHLGHMKLFEKISKSFDYPIWLIVGVHSNPTVMSYKRQPIINEKFRIESVKLCKYVDEVWGDASLVVTKEFCIQNHIDVIIIGEEYKGNKDIIWYQGGMELGIHKYISRFEELSTTDIINRIKINE